MNVVGKILAFLNLIFAIVIAGFVALQYSASKDWKDAYENKVSELRASNSQIKTWRDSATKYKADYNALKGQGGEYFAQDVKKGGDYAADVLKWQLAAENEKNTRLELAVSLTEAQTALKTRTKEAELNRELNEKQGEEIRNLNKEVAKLKTDLTTSSSQLATILGRAQAANDELKELRRKYFELESLGKDTGPASPVKNMKEPNPPLRAVVGKVLRADGADVHIDVGLDHGVQDNNTLEVFRTNPKAEYVGILRIQKSYAREAVGRLQPIAGVVRPIRAGDTVADRLDR